MPFPKHNKLQTWKGTCCLFAHWNVVEQPDPILFMDFYILPIKFINLPGFILVTRALSFT